MFLHVEHVFGSLDLPSENGFENDTPDIYWISWGSQCPSLETQTRRSTTSCAEANESQPSIRLIRQNAWTLTSRLFNLQSLPPCPDSLANETTIAQGVQVNLSLCFWAKYYQYIYINKLPFASICPSCGKRRLDRGGTLAAELQHGLHEVLQGQLRGVAEDEIRLGPQQGPELGGKSMGK